MKRFLSALLTLCLVLTLLPASALAATPSSGKCGENVTYQIDSSGVLTVSGSGPMTDYTFRNESPFSFNWSITEVVIESGVTHIGDEAFKGLGKVSRISIPSTVLTIGQNAFGFCGMYSVEIPEGVTSIGTNAFNYCENLSSVDLPDSLKSIGYGAFSHTAISSVYLGRNMEKIDLEAFNTDTFRSYSVGWGNKTFSELDGVLFSADETSLLAYPRGKTGSAYTVPDGVTTIAENAFFYAKKLGSVTLPDSVTEIEKSAFYGSGITSVSIPSGVKEISSMAFSDCKALSEVTIQEGVETLGFYAFSDCGSLARVDLPKSVTKISDQAFQDCPALKDVYYGGSRFDWENAGFASLFDSGVAIHYADDTQIQWEVRGGKAVVTACLPDLSGELVIPDTLDGCPVTAIAPSAFADAAGMTSVRIPESVTSIGENSFSGCTALRDVYYAGVGSQWSRMTQSVDTGIDADVELHFGTMPITDCRFSFTNDKTEFRYTGQPVVPDFALYLGDGWDRRLKEGRDYTTELENNVNAGAATLRVTGMGDYSGTMETTFTILKVEPELRFEKALLRVALNEPVPDNPLTAVTDGRLTFTSDDPDIASVDSATGKVTPKGYGVATIRVTAEEGTNYLGGTASYLVNVSTWRIDDNNVLHVYAPAVMDDYDIYSVDQRPPWESEKDRIVGVVVHEGVTHIGEYAFARMGSLKEVTIPTTLKSIGEGAFYLDTALESVNYDSGRRQLEAIEVTKYNNDPFFRATFYINMPNADVHFSDVPEGEYYAKAVQWALDYEITNGTSATTFSPNATCTRGQVVTFLWRAKNCPEPTSARNPFIDVPADAYYYKAVLWAVENGVTNGTSANTFSPDSPCTRGHVVTFLWRAEGQLKVNRENPFKDVPAGQYYTEAVLWAVNRGITNGTSASKFSPDQACSRAQIVTFLWRCMSGEKAELPPPEITREEGVSYCINAMHSIQRQWPYAVGIMGYYSRYRDQEGNVATYVEITYRIGDNKTQYKDTFLYVNGQKIDDPIDYYGKQADRAYGAAKLRYKQMQIDVTQAAAKMYPGGTVSRSELNQ